MLSLTTLVTVLLASPLLVSAGMYPKNSGVTMLDDKGFRALMKEEVELILLLSM